MNIPIGYVFANTSEERARIRNDIEPLARICRHDILFGVADPVDLEDVVDGLHLNASRLPIFAILDPQSNLRYPMNNPPAAFFDVAIKIFVQDFLDGSLRPTVKSEPVPENPKDAVVKVVGLNWHDVVMDAAKDVLLVFCVTSCGPCVVLQPTLEMLAAQYAAHETSRGKVTIAKVMYDENDSPVRGVRAFPTIMLYPAFDKSAFVRFLGDRSVDALAGFIRDSGSHKADLND